MSLKVTRENLVDLPALAPYFGLGLVAFLFAPAFLLAGSDALESGLYRHPRLLAAVHVYALGWGTAVALGALQQMVPVVFNTVLYRPRWAHWAFLSYAVGLAALVAAFLTLSRTAFWIGALGLPLGVLLVLTNVMLTLRTGQATPRGQLVEPFVRASLVYLLAAVLAGAALALNFATGWLGPSWDAVFPLHVVTTSGGWFLMLIVGISYHLLTFFGLTEKKKAFHWPATVRQLLHLALTMSLVAAVLLATGLPVPASLASGLALLLAATAAGLFLWDTRDLYAPRSRERMHPLVGYIRVAHVYLALCAAGLALMGVAGLGAASPPSWISALGFLLAAGWMSHTVLGYLHRILPFFIWHNRYWGRGREPGVPAFRHMIHHPTAWIALVIYNIGVAGAAISLVTSLPLMPFLWILAAGGALAAGNLLWTLIR